MNLFEIADQNSDNLMTEYDDLKKDCVGSAKYDMLNEFSSKVETDWCVSINIRQSALLDFLKHGSYKNIYELKRDQQQEFEDTTGQEASLEEGIRGHLKKHYGKRMKFDSYFEDAKMFKYGALNVGGLGIHGKNFGEFCIVIKRDSLNSYSTLIFLKQDSLNNYVNDCIKTDQLKIEIANRRCVHLLTALKHAEKLETIPSDKWSYMICSSKDYIEAITKDDILCDHVKTIRISSDDQKKYFDFLYRAFVASIDDFEKYWLQVFKSILELLDKKGILLEVVNKDEN